MKSLSRVRLFATPWTVAYQAPPSMGFSRQECWSGVPQRGKGGGGGMNSSEQNNVNIIVLKKTHILVILNENNLIATRPGSKRSFFGNGI